MPKRRKSAVPKAAASAAPSSNPFERRGNSARQKHPVLNRKVKGAQRNVAASRAKAVARRKRTLLVEHRAKGKANAFVDRRFGENDPTLPEEERMLARFQRVRMKKARRSERFALDDEPEDGGGDGALTLTHRGVPLGQGEGGGDDYDARNEHDLGSSDEEMGGDIGRGGGGLTAEEVEALQFGGGEFDAARLKQADDSEPRKKTHKEIMAEVVAKSKMYKAMRSQQKERDLDQLDALDAGFKDLTELLDFRPSKNDPDAEPRPKPDEYDRMSRALGLSARAQATDRKRTPEEVAERERQRLEKLEEERLRRMTGADESDSDGSGSGSGSEDEEDEEEEAPLGEDYSSEEEEDDDGDDEQEGSGQDDDQDQPKAKKQKKQQQQEVDENAIPFVLDCPADSDEYDALLRRHVSSVDDERTVLKRLLTLYSPKLSVENQEKTRLLAGVLLQRFTDVAGSARPDVAVLDLMTRALYRCCEALPRQVPELLRVQLVKIQSRVGVAVRKRKPAWPSTAELLQLRLATQLFSASDRRHPVVSPAMVLLGQCLAQCPVLRVRDAAAGLLCAGTALDAAAEAGRLAPEAVGFVAAALLHFAEAPEVPPVPTFAALGPLALPADVQQPLPRVSLASLGGGGSGGGGVDRAQRCAELLGSALALAVRLGEQYASSPAAPELLAPVRRALARLAKRDGDGGVPAAAREAAREAGLALVRAKAAAEAARVPLTLQAHAPEGLQSLNPRLDMNPGVRGGGEDKEKRQRKQLKREISRERRGAARELRLDSAFLAEERDRERDARDADRKAELRANRVWLEQQRPRVR